jgi:hypothetical protein
MFIKKNELRDANFAELVKINARRATNGRWR